ncbi:MAG: MutS family DNA mismatch repair protein [Nitrospira sp.]|nr:MutS family DNA mismatch repair protein [Nitrospira sp.]MCP9443133.1 MutS family DNA mismatch repair protein [Nitrospira sp.]
MDHRSRASRSRAEHFDRLIGRIDRLIGQGMAISARFTTWRLVIFVTGLVCIVTLYRSGWYHAGNAALAGFIGLFLAVAAYHNKLEGAIQRLRRWKQIKTIHLARLKLDWPSLPLRQWEAPPSHLYAKDLDLVGPHSLLHLLDTTISDHGRTRLTSWLLDQPPTPETWTRRQQVVRDLTARSLFRDRLALLAQLAGDEEINGRRLEAALLHPVGFRQLHVILAIQTCLACGTILLGTGALLGWIPGYWMFSFGAYVVIYFLTDQGEELLEHAVGLHHEMERLGTVLCYVERQAQRRPSALAELCAPLITRTAAPSLHVKQVARTLHAISVKANPLLHLFVNALCPWDLWFARRLSLIQTAIRDHLPLWLDCLAEIEAACALANFSHLHPDYAWPTLNDPASDQPVPGVLIAARRLGHPLLPGNSRIPNDFQLEGLGSIHLITGSNMSGKSTFLRTVGINLCLAQAGAPVCAADFRWTWSRLACCIRIDDSLDAGLSFFYAEVKRLKAILDLTSVRGEAPVLFLIDEIFRGTNNRERLIGSRAYIRTLSMSHGFGLISTHDLELTDLEKDIPSLTNFHFRETVSGSTLHFDYQLHSGPCPTTNALRIMQLEGLPISSENNGA